MTGWDRYYGPTVIGSRCCGDPAPVAKLNEKKTPAIICPTTHIFINRNVTFHVLGLACPKFAVHNALSYYSIEPSDGENFYHVTACYSPRDRRLAGSSYHKSPAVVKALGQISQVSIIGCVITKDTVSARVSLTKKQSQLWMNGDETGQQRRRRGTVQ